MRPLRMMGGGDGRGRKGRDEVTTPHLFQLRGDLLHCALELADSDLFVPTFGGATYTLHEWCRW